MIDHRFRITAGTLFEAMQLKPVKAEYLLAQQNPEDLSQIIDTHLPQEDVEQLIEFLIQNKDKIYIQYIPSMEDCIVKEVAKTPKEWTVFIKDGQISSNFVGPAEKIKVREVIE